MKILSLLLVGTMFIPSAVAKQREVTLKCIVGKGKDSLALPAVSTPLDKKATIQMTRELHVPVLWSPPVQSVGSKGTESFLPATPLEFEKVHPGLVIQCRVDETKEGLLRISGTATYSEVELAPALHGEKSGPLYSSQGKKAMLTPNKADSSVVLSSATRFQLFAMPGKTYEFKIRRFNRKIPIRLTCDYKK